MNDKIRNVLKKLEAEGFSAFVVGGFVRDYLLGIETFDVDIATSAEPKNVKEIFALNNATDENYGSVYLKDKLYNYDITTYRKELKYKDRKPVEYKYIETIEEDILRRDFTINSLYMDSDGNIHDKVDAIKDIEEKRIRMIGNIQDKMTEDPLRILRALRFAATLNFELESNLKIFIKQNTQLLRTLSYTRKKEELDKIFASSTNSDGLKLIKELNLEKDLELVIPNNVVATSNQLGIWAQLEVIGNYNFSNSEKETINKVKKILNYGIIDNIVLYEYGIFPAIIAADILNINRNCISDIYKKMPIYTSKDIKINGDDILKLLNITPGEIIKEIINDIEINILNGTLKNDETELKNYIIDNWR